MAGTLIVTEELCWMTPNYVHNNVLETMAKILEPNDPSLAATLFDSRTFENGGYLDLRPYDKETIAKLSRAAGDAERKYEKEGADSFYDPGFYPGFMKHMKELKEMLRAAIL